MMKHWWDDCRRYTMPQDSNPDYANTRSEGKHKAIPVDATAVDLLEKMTNGLHSATVSYGDRWFSLQSNGGYAMKRWCANTTRDVIYEMQKSNFVSVASNWVRHICGYGTGIIYIGEENGRPRYRNISVTDNVCLETDMFGDVCVVYVAYQMTALQAVQQFGIDNPALSSEVKREFKEANSLSSKKHTFIHVVYPKELFGEKVAKPSEEEEFPYDEKYRPFGGIFIEKDTEKVVASDGFFEFPFAVVRPILAGDEIYGRSIPMLAMEAIRSLNRSVALQFDASEMAIRPPIGVPAGFPKLNLVPGAVMKCPMSNPNQIWTYTTQANIPISDHQIARLTDQLRSMFKEDFFMAVTKRSEMSATEVAERVRQASDFISPLVMNLHHDGFRPIVLRTLGILERAGRIAKRPEQGAGIEVSFLSRIDSMIRQADASRQLSVLNQAASVGQAIAVNPDLDNVLNKDMIYDEFMEAAGVNAGIMYDHDERNARRQAAAEAAAAAQQQAMNAQMMSKTDLTKAVDPRSVIAQAA